MLEFIWHLQELDKSPLNRIRSEGQAETQLGLPKRGPVRRLMEISKNIGYQRWEDVASTDGATDKRMGQDLLSVYPLHIR